VDYVVAIPTHRRALTLLKRTMRYLETTNLDLDKVTLFLSDDEDFDEYSLYHDLDMCVTNEKNATEKFNAIHFHYPVGTRVFVMEDDIHNLCYRDDHATTKRTWVKDLDGMICESFKELGEGGIWGINPSDSTHYTAMFTELSPSKEGGKQYRFSRRLNLIVAHAFGFVSTCDPELAVQEASKTDYERSCLYYERYGEVLRRFDIGVMTKSYEEEGGMQSNHSHEERALLEDEACDNLVRRFPELLDHNFNKKSIFSELRLRYRR